ncbi:MAG TPA: hypothetical protein PKB04_03945, partial [Phenylobacterium sp.]|nr:hypothetical protein [Phenylobacterium sp.]
PLAKPGQREPRGTEATLEHNFDKFDAPLNCGQKKVNAAKNLRRTAQPVLSAMRLTRRKPP